MKSRQLSFLPSLLVMPSSSSTNWPWPMVILSNQLAVIFSTHDYECLYLLHCNCVSITRCASSHLQKCQNSVSRLCRLCTRCKNVVLVQLELWTINTYGPLYHNYQQKRVRENITHTQILIIVEETRLRPISFKSVLVHCLWLSNLCWMIVVFVWMENCIGCSTI